jgi:hypothetical protein
MLKPLLLATFVLAQSAFALDVTYVGVPSDLTSYSSCQLRIHDHPQKGRVYDLFAFDGEEKVKLDKRVYTTKYKKKNVRDPWSRSAPNYFKVLSVRAKKTSLESSTDYETYDDLGGADQVKMKFTGELTAPAAVTMSYASETREPIDRSYMYSDVQRSVCPNQPKEVRRSCLEIHRAKKAAAASGERYVSTESGSLSCSDLKLQN